MIKYTAPLLCFIPSAWAHDGHGVSGLHAHATDAWGLVVGLTLAATLALWLRGRK